jgi:hypothetical protein
MSMTRTSFARAVLIVVIISLLLPIGAPRAVASHTNSSGWWCAWEGCKYAQAKIEWNTNIYTTTSHIYRGGTASQSCDPSNDVTSWRVKTQHTGGSWGPWTSIWSSSCNVYSATTTLSVNTGYSSNNAQHFWFTHQRPGPDFYPTVHFSKHVIDNVYRPRP